MPDFAIQLWTNLANTDRYIRDITPFFTRWQHSTRAVGGNWIADGEYQSTTLDMEQFFLSNLGRRIKVVAGGIPWWEGQIVRMEYTNSDGQTFERSMEDMANRVKVIYSKIGDNLLTNGDVESGVWDTVGTPSTHETTTAWYSKGTTAMHVITDGMATEGTSASDAIAISASTAYDCIAVVKVVTGLATLKIHDGTAASNLIAQRTSTGTGREQLQTQIPVNNDATTCDVQVIADNAGDEFYVDGAMLYTSPVRSETEWVSDAESITEFGRIEGVYLEREMSDNEADANAQRYLSNNAWPKTKPERRGREFDANLDIPSQAHLVIACQGLVWTLRWRHSITDGTDQADNHVSTLLDESEFVASSSAAIDTNTTEVYLTSEDPVTLWRQIEKCVEVGDGSGNSWMGGVYPGRVFQFEARPTGTQYEFHRNAMRFYGGGRIPPLEFRPGWCLMTDMPMEPAPAGGTTDDDPRRVWLDETTFVYRDGKTMLQWAQEDERQ